jgi:hypothetical protein
MAEEKRNNLSKRQHGALVRKEFLKLLKTKWGDYESIKGYLYSFSNGQKLLTLYSNLNHDRWFYGVSNVYWINWDRKTHMCLLMRDGKLCSFIHLSPELSLKLLRMIKPAHDGQKKINIRIPSAGHICIQEWPNFSLQHKIISFGKVELASARDSLEIKHMPEVPFNRETDPLTSAKILFHSMSKSERENFLKQLRQM